MKLVQLYPGDLVISEDLARSGSAKQFEDRLRASIEEIGLAEPLKVALLPSGKYLVVDGVLRLRAIRAVRDKKPEAFKTLPAYVTSYEHRYEIRYQTDIYQDLLPSQLAALVEHLHKAERVRKTDIARYIGVSPTTLRNYTGLWRLLQRGGLFANVVELMDVGVMPSSNPYAWLRLTARGLVYVIEASFSAGEAAEIWVADQLSAARLGHCARFTTDFVESSTGSLQPEYYRVGEDLRSVKRDLGLRRAVQAESDLPKVKEDRPQRRAARRHLSRVSRESTSPVLQLAARSLAEYLK